jgi:hypothetical protein
MRVKSNMMMVLTWKALLTRITGLYTVYPEVATISANGITALY